MTNASAPRTFSRISTRHSSFAKVVTSALPRRVRIFLAISSASARFELPAKRTGFAVAITAASRCFIDLSETASNDFAGLSSSSPKYCGQPFSESTFNMPKFEVVSPFRPSGDQPHAVARLSEGIKRGDRAHALLGVTGSGKTATMSWTIEQVQKPTLVLCHNKTLAAQLCSEFKEFFPNNAVEYFVSYFDYYQPEAYIASTDTYIEKDSSINEEIERLRHSATQSLLTRRDTIIVASVSCIFGLGSPSDYMEMSLKLRRGEAYDRDKLLRKLVDMQYTRNDIALVRGTFRVRGDVLEYVAVDDEIITRLDFFGDQIEHITRVNQVTGELIEDMDEVMIFPAKHFITPEEKLLRAVKSIEAELEERLAYFRANGKRLRGERRG